MIIRLFLSQTLEEANSDLDLRDWFDSFYQLMQQDEKYAKAIALFFDYESPLDANADVEENLLHIQASLGWTDHEVEYFKHVIAEDFEEGETFATLISNAITDYCRYQKDVTKEFRKALEAQIVDQSRQLYGTKIDIKSVGSEKSFERFQKLSEKADMINENIRKLSEKEQKDYEALKDEVQTAIDEMNTSKAGRGNAVKASLSRNKKNS